MEHEPIGVVSNAVSPMEDNMEVVPMMNFDRFPKWVFRQRVFYTLSKSAIYVLGCLCDALDHKTDTGSIKTSTIVETTGLSKQSVCNALVELAEAGIVDRPKGQARFTLIDPDEVKHALPRSSTLDSEGQAGFTPRSSTVDLEVKHALPTVGRNKDRPRTLTKNSYQEGECASDGLIPYSGKRVDPATVHGPLLDRIGWPEARRGNAKNLIAHALLALADGAEGDEASADPVVWLGERLKVTADDAEGPRYFPKISTWFDDNYPHLVASAKPFGSQRRYA